ncbi:hypothetical protein ACO1O0_003272 [Amphichorda felina]
MSSKKETSGSQEGAGEEKKAASPGPATFEGRLQLKDFMFSSHSPTDSDAAPRRSPRLSRPDSALTAASETSSPSSSSAPQPTKRKTNSQTASSSSSPSPKRKRQSSSYAPPSTYAHLAPLPDAIAPNLLVLFIGLNPGIQTARSGHAYAHPSNLFWKLLFSSGVTPRPCTAQEDRSMPELFSLGLTNIVGRPSRNGAELSRREMDDGVAALEEKARRWRPESMCIVGKSIWESIWRVRHGGRAVGKDFKYGWQDETENMGVIDGEWPGARVFVATSTSGLAATTSKAEKERIWNELGAFVKKRRVERAAEGERRPESLLPIAYSPDI